MTHDEAKRDNFPTFSKYFLDLKQLKVKEVKWKNKSSRCYTFFFLNSRFFFNSKNRLRTNHF